MRKYTKQLFFTLLFLIGILFLLRERREGFIFQKTMKENERCSFDKKGDSCLEGLFCFSRSVNGGQGTCKRNCRTQDKNCRSDEYCKGEFSQTYCEPLNGKVRVGSICTSDMNCIIGKCDCVGKTCKEKKCTKN